VSKFIPASVQYAEGATSATDNCQGFYIRFFDANGKGVGRVGQWAPGVSKDEECSCIGFEDTNKGDDTRATSYLAWLVMKP